MICRHSLLSGIPMPWIAFGGSCFLAVIVLMPLLLLEGNQSFGSLVEREAQSGGDACAIGGIGLGAVSDVALLDFDARVTHGAGSVLEEKLLLLGGHLPEQVAGLLIVIISDAMTTPSLSARK